MFKNLKINFFLILENIKAVFEVFEVNNIGTLLTQ